MMNTSQTYKMKDTTNEHGDNKAKSTPIGMIYRHLYNI